MVRIEGGLAGRLILDKRDIYTLEVLGLLNGPTRNFLLEFLRHLQVCLGESGCNPLLPALICLLEPLPYHCEYILASSALDRAHDLTRKLEPLVPLCEELPKGL